MRFSGIFVHVTEVDVEFGAPLLSLLLAHSAVDMTDVKCAINENSCKVKLKLSL
jgi:hypothetical protein